MMNKKVKEFGMFDINFVNLYGFDVENYYISVYDVVIMLREFLKYKIIRKYFIIWVDIIREGKFGFININKFVRFYRGCMGVKIGFIDKVKFCVLVLVLRNGFYLIVVIMGVLDSKIRFNEAIKFLDWGFVNFLMYSFYFKGYCFGKVKIKNGIEKEVEVILSIDVKFFVKKGDESIVELKVVLF